MMNEKNMEDKRLEKLTEEDMEQVTGGSFRSKLVEKYYEKNGSWKPGFAFIGDYTYCPFCKDYTKTVLLSGNKVCGNCGTPRETP